MSFTLFVRFTVSDLCWKKKTFFILCHKNILRYTYLSANNANSQTFFGLPVHFNHVSGAPMVVKRIRLAVSHDAVIRIDVSHNRHFAGTTSSTLPIADYTFRGGKIEKSELRRERCPDLVSPHFTKGASDDTKIFNPITQTTRLPRKYLLLCRTPPGEGYGLGFCIHIFSVFVSVNGGSVFCHFTMPSLFGSVRS